MSTFEKYMQSLSYDTLGICEVYTLNGTRIRGKIAYLGNMMLLVDNTVLPVANIARIGCTK